MLSSIKNGDLWSEGPSIYHETGCCARGPSRRSSRRMMADPIRLQGIVYERHPHFTPTIALAVCGAFLAPVVGADATLSFSVPSEVTLCQPINLTWTDGAPPYRLDVEPFVNNSPNRTANQRNTGIQTTWILWTPDFPPGSLLQITVSDDSTDASGFATVLSSSDLSCLDSTSTTSLPSPSTSSTNNLPPSATSPRSTLASSVRGLSKGAIAGIAIAACVVGIGLIALVPWYFLRRRNRVKQPEMGYDRSIVAPSAPSTLVAVDKNKPTPGPAPLVGRSPDALEEGDRFRPTPYLVPCESTADLPSLCGTADKKHMRGLSTSKESATNVNMSTSEPGVRDGDDTGDRGVDAPPRRSLGVATGRCE